MKMRRDGLVIGVCLSCLIFKVDLSSVSAASIDNAPARHYKIVDLGIIARISADIIPGLSNSGITVTWGQLGSTTFTALLRDGKQLRVLHAPVGYQNSFAYSVNDRGNAAGWSNTTINPVDSASIVHATFFSRNRSFDIGTLGGLRSRAYAINNNDVIVGVAELSDETQAAFIYAEGKMIP